MTQFDVNDFCKSSFGVDNVVVFLFIFFVTDNFDIVNMYKCSKSKIFFCFFMPNCLFTSNWVKVCDSRRMCKPCMLYQPFTIIIIYT